MLLGEDTGGLWLYLQATSWDGSAWGPGVRASPSLPAPCPTGNEGAGSHPRGLPGTVEELWHQIRGLEG